MHQHRVHLAMMVLSVFMLTNCAPAAPGRDGGTTSSAGSSAPSDSQGPKTMTVAFRREPASIGGFAGVAGSAGDAGEIKNLVHNYLTVLDPEETAVPQLA